MNKQSSAAIMEDLVAGMAEYYQAELTAKLERGIKMEEKQSAAQLLESINAAIEEWFQAEIGAHEGKTDEE